MDKQAAVGLTLVAVGLVGAAGVLLVDDLTSGAVLAAAAAVALFGALVGVRRSRAATGRVDLFHPALFPSLYVAVASLAPVAWLYVAERPLGYITTQLMAPHTPILMALASVGFTLGCLIVPRGRVKPGKKMDPRTLGAAGRLLLLVPLVLAARDFAGAVVGVRGLGQSQFTAADVLNALGMIAAPAAVSMILASRQQLGKRLLGPADAAMMLGLVVLLGLNGRRGAALGVMVVLLFFATRRKGANLRAVLGFGAMLVFTYAVVVYRTAATGGRTTLSSVAVLLRDLGSVAFTTGATAQALPPASEFGGSTIVAGLVRQLPSPIVNSLLGPPDDTGAFVFRTLTGLGNNRTGFGFSLPAEGVLNFGTVGAFLVPAAAGVLLAWMYARFDPGASKALALLYPVAVGTVPFAWRSDTLGAVKGVLYPALILWATLIVARTVAATNARLGTARARPPVAARR